MEVSLDYVEKSVNVLELLLKPDFKVVNETRFASFLEHLIRQIKEDNNYGVVQWLIKASAVWYKSEKDLSSAILCFMLNMASKVSKTEKTFVDLNSQNTYENMIGIVQLKTVGCEVTVALIDFFSSILQHKSGLQWVLATTYWNGIIELGRNSQNETISEKAYKFISLLLQKTISLNRNFCRAVLIHLLKPLNEAAKHSPEKHSKQQFLHGLWPHLVFLNDISEDIAKNSAYAVLNVFMELQVDEVMKKLLEMSENEDLSSELLKIPCIIMFFKVVCVDGKRQCEKELTMLDRNARTAFLLNEVNKGHMRSPIKMCYFGHILLANMKGEMPRFMRKGYPIEFQNQLLLLQLMPILLHLGSQSKTDLQLTENDDIYAHEYAKKVVNMSSVKIMELAYRWQEKLLSRSDVLDIVTFALAHLMRSKGIMNKEQAAVCFQTLVYSLQKNVILIKEQKGANMSPSYSMFLNSLINALIDLGETFNLTWSDSIVTISIMSIACEFLEIPYWDDKLIISSLMLLNLAIAKHMSPNMILLMDNPKDSLILFIGKMLNTRCQSVNWEIREAAMENIYTLSISANSKFPYYARDLLEAGLPQLALQKAFNNEEEYCVRTTAFRCLQELMQIEDLSDIFSDINRILTDILLILEGGLAQDSVRKEAVTLLKCIYKHRDFPAAILPRVYDTMSVVTVEDAYWEVRLNGLMFWVDVLQIHLNNQGMLDGNFPEVTFSKELRKIVTLNDSEVRKRIIKVLNQMSRIGCLYVIKCACSDKHSQLAAKTREVIELIVNLCKNYKVVSGNAEVTNCYETEWRGPTSPTVSNTMTASECSDFDFTEFSLELPTPPDGSVLSVLPTENLEEIMRQTEIDELVNDLMTCATDEIFQDIRVEKSIGKNSTYLAPTQFLQFAMDFHKGSPEREAKDEDCIKFRLLLNEILKEYERV